MQRERVLLPTKRFAITVRLVAKGRAWRAGVEAVHGERVCRAVRGTGLPFSYKYIQTTYYTPHYYTHHLLGQAVSEIWHCLRIWISVLISDRGRISGAYSCKKGRKRNRLPW